MENPRMLPGSMDEIPEDLRCKRSDGKQWRCSALSMPDKTVCEKHYVQAKRRAANSAMRASQKKARRGSSDDTDIYLESKQNGAEMSSSLSPMDAGGLKCKEKFGNSQPSSVNLPEVRGAVNDVINGVPLSLNKGRRRDGMECNDIEERLRSAYNSSSMSKEVKNTGGGSNGDYHWKSSESGEAEGLTCHQCRRSDRANVAWCMSCDRKGYCSNCILQWYADIPVEDIRKICPACRGICNCKFCLRGDNLIKTKVQEIACIDKLKYLHGLLSSVLPVLKQIYSEQCFEIAAETRIHGMATDIPRANIHADEQMCCNLCRIPIFDFHRHCTHCLYDLCLTCCRDIRRSPFLSIKGESATEKRISDKLMLESTNENAINFSRLFPLWKANTDGSIPCPPEEAGGCGYSKLVLRRILKINWAAKLVKNAEEIVSGCKVSDLQDLESCASCMGHTSLLSADSGKSKLNQCSNRDGTADNFLYHPTSEVLKHEGTGHFRKHWIKGEPVIVEHVFDHSLASSWDPMSIWRGIQETADERLPQHNTIVKAIDLLKQSEVDIELAQFIKGYSEGLKHEDGWPKMLILKDWPSLSAWEEFILCQRPEFLTNLPLVEFIHPKWGLLNLAAKLPHYMMQAEAGPKVSISYGTHNELGKGDPVTNLHINMSDVVYLLMHSAEARIQGSQKFKREKCERIQKENDNHSVGNPRLPNADLDLDVHSPDLAHKEHTNPNELSGTEMPYFEKKFFHSSQTNNESGDAHQKVRAGAIWDVFRRQDVPKLNEFLSVNWGEFTTAVIQPGARLVYEQSVYLDKHHKRKLKEEYNVEPWTFGQHVGEAVFVPAGCPFQVRNLQSTVQLSLDFLSPESLKECCKMAKEIRCLTDDHDAKLKMLEVGKMCLYAASSAIREIQKIALDPKLSSDIKFEDHNLTAMVAENLERITKRRQVACT